jgi:hypothetical protein
LGHYNKRYSTIHFDFYIVLSQIVLGLLPISSLAESSQEKSMDFTRELKAANVIRTRGIEGANEVALMVGMSTALAMVLVHIEGDDKNKLALVHDAGLNNVADLDLLSGRAVIYEEGHGSVVAALEIKEGTCVDVNAHGLNISMWMQGSGEIKSIFAGKSPYTEVREILLREHNIALDELMARIKNVD